MESKGEKINMTGKVKWFNPKKGYGFITVDELEKDVYVHFTDIKQDGYKTLEIDQLVSFDYDAETNAALNVVKSEEK